MTPAAASPLGVWGNVTASGCAVVAAQLRAILPELETPMKMMMIAAAAALMATGAMASGKPTPPPFGFSGGGSFEAGAHSASGFVSGPSRGAWSVGAMNESFGFAGVSGGSGGVEGSTSSGSITEGFGSGQFGGFVGGGGSGFGYASGGGSFGR